MIPRSCNRRQVRQRRATEQQECATRSWTSPHGNKKTQQAAISYYDGARSKRQVPDLTMPSESITAELALDVKAELGEGAIWDADRQRLLFVDITRGYVHQFDPETRAHRHLEAGRMVSAIAPTVRGDWVLAAQGGFFRMNPDTGRVIEIAAVETDLP